MKEAQSRGHYPDSRLHPAAAVHLNEDVLRGRMRVEGKKGRKEGETGGKYNQLPELVAAFPSGLCTKEGPEYAVCGSNPNGKVQCGRN